METAGSAHPGMVWNVQPQTCAKDSEVERVFARRTAGVEAMHMMCT